MSATVKLIHSNHKNEVIIYASQVFAVMFLPQNQTTAVVGVGGAMVPVMGTVDEVKQQINQAMAATNSQGEKNGTTGRTRNKKKLVSKSNGNDNRGDDQGVFNFDPSESV